LQKAIAKKEEFLRFFAMLSFYKKHGIQKRDKSEKSKSEAEDSEFKFPSGDLAFLKQSMNSPARESNVDRRSPVINFRHSFSPSRNFPNGLFNFFQVICG